MMQKLERRTKFDISGQDNSLGVKISALTFKKCKMISEVMKIRQSVNLPGTA